MNMWIRLSAEESHDFQIPWDVAKSSLTQFFSTATLTNLYFDGSWPLLGFKFDSKNPHTVCFQPCRVDFDFINEVDDYNPLEEGLGHKISLNRRELIDLISILEDIAQDMAAGYERPFRTLTPLTPLQHHQFRIPSQQKETINQRVFIQTAPLFNQSAENPQITLVILSSLQIKSRSHQNSPRRFHLQVCQFNKCDLLNESFNPLQHAKNSITLDSRGVREIATLLRNFMCDEETSTSLFNVSLPTPIYPNHQLVVRP